VAIDFGEKMNTSNNTILITGGTSGIGFELAKQLSQRGNKIIITGRDQAKLETSKKLLPEIHTIQSDVSKNKDIEELFDRITQKFPELNILINNAGIMRTINLHSNEGNLDDITREIDINLSGPIRMTQKFLLHLKSKPTAAIINVSSGLAFVPLPNSPVYCATKAALHSFTLSLRVQLKKTNIKVFELAPPATETELLGKFNPEDMKGVPIMKVDEMVAIAIRGLESDRFEIRPGQSNQLKLMSRLAPEFILKQMSKPIDRMLSETP
jgi:uncharacterized oxidoreductase